MLSNHSPLGSFHKEYPSPSKITHPKSSMPVRTYVYDFFTGKKILLSRKH